MPTLTDDTITRLLEPYFPEASKLLVGHLSIYLDLLLKWNAHTNLTAIREPEEIIRRHFGESLFAGRHLPAIESMLDFGSGAGFPGLPIQLLHPELAVTLGESQNKKVAFLREAVRALGLTTEVWGGRIETMPQNQLFDLVILRAVDNMPVAIVAAASRATKHLAILTTDAAALPLDGFATDRIIAMPGSGNKVLLIASRILVL